MLTDVVAQTIQACQWFPSHYLILSENVFSPLLYYSYLGTLIPMLLIGIFVLIQNPRQLLNRLLFCISISFGLWVFGALVIWATEHPPLTMFFWSVINLIEPFIYFFSFYFAYVFLIGTDFSLRQKILFALPLVPTLLLASTHGMLLGYDLSNCDRNAFEGALASYGYIVEIFYVISIIVSARRAYRDATDLDRQSQIKLLTLGIGAFLLSFSLGNIVEVFTENWYIGQYGLFGAPVFVGLLAFIIVRYKAMNIKILGAQVLILALMIVMGSIIFVDSLENVYAILMPSIVLVAIAGYYLIHSVQLEVQQREKLEILSTQLSAANAKLTELDTLKSQFLSFASHQLRTPLTAIKWQSQLLRDGTVGTLPEKALEIARGIEDSTQRMLELVSEFLNLRKLEEGKMEYSFEPTDVVELTSHIVEDIRPLASHKSLELTFTTHATTSLCSVDRQKFTQVIQNLVDNAIKYTDRGYVRVVVDNPQSKQIRIAVTDSGHGIDPTVISSLFEQFVRDKKDAKTIEGTGLGLYIAKQMIDAHKGTISASSDGKGKGSTFAVQLPTL